MNWLDELFSVRSVFGRTGAVLARLGDYVASLIGYDSATSGRPATVRDALDALFDAPTILPGTGISAITVNVSGTSALAPLDAEGLADAAVVRLVSAPAAQTTLSGIAAPPARAENAVLVMRVLQSSATTLSLVHNDFGVPAENRLFLSEGSFLVSVSGNALTLVFVYDRSVSRWVLASVSPAHALHIAGRSFRMSPNLPLVNGSIVALDTVNNLLVPVRSLPARPRQNLTNAAVPFSESRAYIWTGVAAPTITLGAGPAADGYTVSVAFPAGSITAISFSSLIDPSGDLAAAFTSSANPHLLTLVYDSSGPYVNASFKRVSAL